MAMKKKVSKKKAPTPIANIPLTRPAAITGTWGELPLTRHDPLDVCLTVCQLRDQLNQLSPMDTDLTNIRVVRIGSGQIHIVFET
jgi:hypothetical protein